MHNVDNHNEAIFLRNKGYTYQEIADAVGISRSTAMEWCRDILLSDDGALALSERRALLYKNKINNLAKINRDRYKVKRDNLQNLAKSYVKNITIDENYSAVMCAIMFWCEGGKDNSSGIRFINSDPVLIESFLYLLRQSFKIDETKFRALIHLHEYHDLVIQTTYWSKLTQIPINQFHAPYLKKNTGKNIKENYPGCISVRYNDSSLGNLLKMIYTEFGNKYRGVR